MTSLAPQTPTKVIIIDEDGDLEVRLYKIDGAEPIITLATGQRYHGKFLATYKVSRAVLIAESPVFKAELKGNFAEGKLKILDTQEGTVDSLELWFRAIHNKITQNMYCIPIEEVWEALEVANYRQLPERSLNDWFGTWLETNDIESLELDEMRELLYPCKAFDYAGGNEIIPKAFAFFTKSLAYQVAEHITEINPTAHRHFHLQSNEIGVINGARGSLRGKVVKGLVGPLGNFEALKCECKYKATYFYIVALKKTKLWPMEDLNHKSVEDILNSPGCLNFQVDLPARSCPSCIGMCSAATVRATRTEILSNYDGLCLDCMDKTRPKISGDFDLDYWYHATNRNWDAKCRIKHGQSTWYFSFLGRRPDMKEFNRRKNETWENRKMNHERKCVGKCHYQWCARTKSLSVAIVPVMDRMSVTDKVH